MRDDLLNASIASGRLQLSLEQKITHYSPVIIGLIIPMIDLFIIFKNYFNNETILKQTLNPLLWFISILYVVLIYLLQHKRLKLKTIESSLDNEDSLMVIREAVENLNWKTIINNKRAIIAKVNNGLLTGSWGEQVIIIFDSNKMYINSICDPNKRPSLASFGNNRKNITTLVQEIKKTAREKGYS